MPESDLFVPFVRLVELCKRAASHRRSLVTDPTIRPAERERLIWYGLPRRDLKRELDGWVQISTLADEHAGIHFRILWDPDTDRLRLQRPRIWDPISSGWFARGKP